MTKQIVGYADWFSEYDFEAMITVRVGDHSIDRDNIPKLLRKEVIEPLQRFLRTYLTGYWAISYGHYTRKRGYTEWEETHVHMLVATERRNLNANIEPVVSFLLRRPNALLLTHPKSIDITPYDPDERRHHTYLAKHLIEDSDIREINPKLLSQIRSPK